MFDIYETLIKVLHLINGNPKTSKYMKYRYPTKVRRKALTYGSGPGYAWYNVVVYV